MAELKAFCPGHVTGFFSVDLSEIDPLRCGSVGVGFCTSVGATATVTDVGNPDDIVITVDNEEAEAIVTRKAMKNLMESYERGVRADIVLQGPVGQGLGMSAAGTYSSCLALTELLGESPARALEAAHSAEVESRTGLGDVVAQSVGGFVIRASAGAPPHGRPLRLDFPPSEVVLCLLDEGISTSSILASPTMVERVSSIGRRCLVEFEREPGLERFVELSWKFATETGLATPPIREMVEAVSGLGFASMVMLGNGIFAFGDADRLQRVLKPYGTVIRTAIHSAPASIV